MKNKKKYKHITKAERLEIAALKKRRYGLREIAGVLRRSPGTISEEIKRNNTQGHYDPEKANHKAYVKRKYSKHQGMKIAAHQALRTYVEKYLNEDWSPEEISGRLKEVDIRLPYASFRVIYKFASSIYGRNLEKHLRYRGKNKKRRPPAPVTKLEGRTFIDQRPKIVADRRRFGDWEGDFIVSGKNGSGVLLVLHERKARYALIKKILHPTRISASVDVGDDWRICREHLDAR